MYFNLYWQMKGYENTQNGMEGLSHEVKGFRRICLQGAFTGRTGPHPCPLTSIVPVYFSFPLDQHLCAFPACFQSLSQRHFPVTVLLLLKKASCFFWLTSLTGEPPVLKSEHKKTNYPHPTGLHAEREETTHQTQPLHPPTKPLN